MVKADKGSTLLIATIVLSSLALTLHSLLSHFYIENQVQQQQFQHQQLIQTNRSHLEQQFQQLAINQFGIFDQLPIGGTQVYSNPLDDGAMVSYEVSKQSTHWLQLKSSLVSSEGVISNQQWLAVRLSKADDDSWMLTHSQWWHQN